MPPSATGTPRTGLRPFGVAGLGHDGLIAPWALDGAMNRDSFETCIQGQLAPALRPGQTVVADNLSSHKSTRAIELLRAQGNDLIFLPPCSPDLNPIEINRGLSRTHGVRPIIFAKLKILIRKAAARTYDQIRKAVSDVCDLFKEKECYNFFKAAGKAYPFHPGPTGC